MYTGKPTADKVLIAKVIIAFVCLLLCGYQIYAGFKMIGSNLNAPIEITDANLSSLSAGTEVIGTIDNIIMEYQGDDVLNGVPVCYFLSKTDDGRLMTYRAEYGKAMYGMLLDLKKGDSSEVRYRGAVHDMTDATKSMLNLQLIAENILGNNGIKGGNKYAMIPFVIDVIPEDAHIGEKYIIFTFIGAALMLLLALLVLRKPIKNLRESIQSRNGEYQPDLVVRQEDLVFENEGYYEGMKEGDTDFFVNTEYNIRGEGNTGLIRDRMDAGSSAGEYDETGDDAPKPPSPPPTEDFFYQNKGTNDEGNFYVDNQTRGYRRY